MKECDSCHYVLPLEFNIWCAKHNLRLSEIKKCIDYINEESWRVQRNRKLEEAIWNEKRKHFRSVGANYETKKLR